MKRIFICCTLSLLVGHCTNELPISELLNNTITLKVLGTYESNDPYGDFGLKRDDIISKAGTVYSIAGSSPSLSYDSTTPTTAGVLAYYAYNLGGTQAKYYIDLAEIRMAQGQGKNSSQSISDYWSQFAISRQLMCSDYSTAETKLLTNCQDANGVDRLSQFFNGGFSYPAVDVKSGSWNHLGIYFRRFVTYPAAVFTGDGSYSGSSQTIAENSVTAAFDNRTIYGHDIENYLQNRYGESVTQGRMFPLERTDLSLQVVEDHEPYVLEVRIFLKNLMMVHLRQVTGNATTASDSSNSALVYVGPADWKVNHAFVDTVSGNTIVGNATRQADSLAMTARMYQPAKVGSIQMSSAANSGEYFAVVAAGTAFTGSVLPLAATAGTNTTISNLPPGSYDVYRTCDKLMCKYTSTGGTCDATVTGTDGYPETVQKCGSSVTVSSGTISSVTTCSGTCP